MDLLVHLLLSPDAFIAQGERRRADTAPAMLNPFPVARTFASSDCSDSMGWKGWPFLDLCNSGFEASMSYSPISLPYSLGSTSFLLAR